MSEASKDPGAPQSGLFVAWARLVLRFRWVMMLASFAITGLFAWQLVTKLATDTSMEAFQVTDSQAFLDLEELRDDFGRDELFIVIAEGDVFTLPFLERLKKLHKELASIDLELETLGQRKTGRAEKPEPKAAAPPKASAAKPDAPKAGAVDGFDDGDDGWGDEETAAPGDAIAKDDAWANDEGWGKDEGGKDAEPK